RADTGNGLKGKMNDAALARVHGVEPERLPRGLHAFSSGASHHLQFFNTQGAVAGAIEKKLFLKGRLEAKRAMSKMLDGMEKLRAALEQQVFIAAGEVSKDFGAAVVGSGARTQRADSDFQIEFGGDNGLLEKFAQCFRRRRAIELAVFNQVQGHCGDN